MSAALESALRAVARIKGDSDVAAEDLKQALDEALGKPPAHADPFIGGGEPRPPPKTPH